MKIEGNRPAHETESLGRTDAKGQKPAPNRAADSGDRVDVSADAKKAQGLVANAVKAAKSLPDVLIDKLRSGQFRSAAVGVCGGARPGQGFTTYRVAVLLY